MIHQIEPWVKHNSNLNIKRLKSSHVEYTKIWINPFSNLFTDIQPNKEFRSKILKGLIQIYDSWEYSLLNFGEPYKIYIWLYEPHFNLSQIVVAVGNKINYYDSIFSKTEIELSFPNEKYETDISSFHWKSYVHEDLIRESEFIESKPEDYIDMDAYQSDQKFYKKLLSKNLRTTDISVNDTITDRLFHIKKGTIFVGMKTEMS